MAQEDTILIWSPRSNIALYGDTALVTEAARLGVRIALGTDWIATGSMNMERELQLRRFLQPRLPGRVLRRPRAVAHGHPHAAEAAKVDDVIGSLAAGQVADIAVFDERGAPRRTGR